MGRMRLVAATAGTLMMAGAVLVACGGDDSNSSTATAGSHLTVTAKEYSFDVTGVAQAGFTTVTLINAGNEPHVLAALKLKAGKTISDATTVISAQNPDPAQVAAVFDEDPSTFHGLPGVVLKGDTQTSITKALKAGNYILLCYLPSPDGQLHYMEGMVRQLTVTAAASPVPKDPKVVGDIAISDTAFTLPPTMKSGTYRVVNNGQNPHGITIARVPAGTTAAQYEKSFNDYYALIGKSPTPTVPVFPYHVVGAFTDSVTPTASADLVLDLTKGHYLVLSDAQDSSTEGLSASFDIN